MRNPHSIVHKKCPNFCSRLLLIFSSGGTGAGGGSGNGSNNSGGGAASGGGGGGTSSSSKTAQASSRQLARSTRARIMRTNGSSVRGQTSRSTGVIIGGTTSGRSLVHTVPATFVPEEVNKIVLKIFTYVKLCIHSVFIQVNLCDTKLNDACRINIFIYLNFVINEILIILIYLLAHHTSTSSIARKEPQFNNS